MRRLDQQLTPQQMQMLPPPPPPQRPQSQLARPQPIRQQPWREPTQRTPAAQVVSAVQPTQSHTLSPAERLLALRRSASAIRAASVLAAPHPPLQRGPAFESDRSSVQGGHTFGVEPKDAARLQYQGNRAAAAAAAGTEGGGAGWNSGDALTTPSAAQAEAAVREDDILFQKLDVDDSGQLSLDETLKLIPAIGLAVSAKYIEGVWSMFDLDRSGQLSREEFGRLMHVLRRKHDAVRTPGSIRSPRPPELSKRSTSYQSPAVTVANPLASMSPSPAEDARAVRPRFSPRRRDTAVVGGQKDNESAASMLADLDAVQIDAGQQRAPAQGRGLDAFARAHAAAQQMDQQRRDLEKTQQVLAQHTLNVLHTPRLERSLELEPEIQALKESNPKPEKELHEAAPQENVVQPQENCNLIDVVKMVRAAQLNLDEGKASGSLSERIKAAGRLHHALLKFRDVAASGVIKAAAAKTAETQIAHADRAQQNEYTKIMEDIDTMLARAARMGAGDEREESIAGYQSAIDHYEEVIAVEILQQHDVDKVRRRIADAQRGIDQARQHLQVQDKVGSGDVSPGSFTSETDSDDEADLIGAFEACDEDNSGRIDAEELYAILCAVGSDITPAMTRTVINECEILFKELADVRANVRACPIFSHLSDRGIRKLVKYLERAEYSAGEVIVREGDTGSEMFMVETGVCSATKRDVQQGAELRRYQAGEIFGERALLDSTARTASVTAMSPQVTVRKLSAANYQKLLLGNPLLNKQLKTQQASYVVALLRSVLFIRSSLSEDQLVEIAAAIEAEDFRQGEVVVSESEAGDCMYIVETGTLEVTKINEGPEPIKILLEGDYFGEVALMDAENNRRSATVTASSECRLLKISKHTFDRILLNRKAQREVRKRIVDYHRDRPAHRLTMQGLAHTLEEGMDETLSVAQLGADKARKLADETTRMGLDNTRRVFEFGHDVTRGMVKGSLSMMGFRTDQDGTLSPDSVNGELDYNEFESLLKGPILQPFLPGSDWRDRVGLIRKLRRAYDMADVDGDNELYLHELEIVLLSLDPSGSTTDADIEYVWQTLNPEQKKSLTWGDFLAGMGRVHNDPRAAAVMNHDVPNKFALISLLIDIKVSKREESELLEGLNFLEKFGMSSLRKMQREMAPDEAKLVLRKAAKGELRQLDLETQGAVVGHQIWVGFQALFIAIFTNGLAGLWENYLTWIYQTDGMYDTYQSNNCHLETKNATIINNITIIEAEVVTVCDELSPWQTILEFWATLLPVVVVCIVIEILLLGIFAIRASCSIASEYNFRLTPLNKERHFVAIALIRACFEMGNHPQRSYGVNPDAEPELETMKGKRLKVVIKVGFYKAKGFVTGFIIKQIFTIFFTEEVLTWLGPYAPGLAACFWNTMITVVIMQRVVMIANGVVTGTEVFNELMVELPRPMSKLGQLMVLRAIGVAVVLEGTMLPTMELLLRHAIQYFNLKGSAMLRDPDVALDSLEQFKHGLPSLPEEEQSVVLRVLLLTEMFDGDLDPEELEFWQEIAQVRHKASGAKGPFVAVNRYALQQVARDFRNRKCITGQQLREAITPGATGKKERELWHRVTQFLLQ